MLTFNVQSTVVSHGVYVVTGESLGVEADENEKLTVLCALVQLVSLNRCLGVFKEDKNQSLSLGACDSLLWAACTCTLN